MGSNLLIVATLALQSPQQDSSADSSTAHGIAFERLSDLLQYNRVQGLSLGAGYRVRLPGTTTANAYGTVRYGLSDDRVTGRLAILGNAASGRLALSGYYDIADLDPFAPGRSVSNTVNGLFAGHDNGDYALARGGSASFEMPIRTGMELILIGRVEELLSIRRVARSAVNDFLGGTGLFPPNPPVDEGTFLGGSARFRGVGTTRWNLTADVLGGAGRTTGRVYGDLRRGIGSGQVIKLRLKAGAGTEPAMSQTFFRLGGLGTVRGFEYGTLRAAAFWAAQVDVTPFFGARVRPVIFLDAGQAARISELFSSSALVGGGVGLSLFSGLIRFDLSRPISPDQSGKVRFDLVIQGAR
jgi:hemolysin secretion/activation protein ShlB/FhaC/HecB